MVTQEEGATVSEGEGEGVVREAGRSQRAGRRDGNERGAQGGRGEQRLQHSLAPWRPNVARSARRRRWAAPFRALL
jgi:hypothetical protein